VKYNVSQPRIKLILNKTCPHGKISLVAKQESEDSFLRRNPEIEGKEIKCSGMGL
jgi:hypothetical protein